MRQVLTYSNTLFFIKKVLVETVIRWGCEAEIEDTDLVREMFALLLRQYDTVGELMRATENTYIVDAKTKPGGFA